MNLLNFLLIIFIIGTIESLKTVISENEIILSTA